MPLYRSLDLYSTLTPTQASTTVSNVSVTILAANLDRKRMLFRNYSSSNKPIFIHFGTPATLTNGYPLFQGEVYIPPLSAIWTGIVTAISETVAAKEIYIEYWD